jgi:hypothetical protein
MLTLLSPAKALNFDPADKTLPLTKPALLRETNKLAEVTRGLTRTDLSRLMSISDNLADLNYQRFQAFRKSATPKGAKQAALAFNGDVYHGLEAPSLSAEELAYAQNHLRILSGLYGVLKPMDAIQPYRLEMGTKLKNDRGATLYDFWGDQVAKQLKRELADHADGSIINLASKEYFKVVDQKALKAPVITPVFRDEKDGKARVIFLFAKQARGMMARWIIENRIDRAEDIKEFAIAGYTFRPTDSNDTELVFQRKQPPAKKAA